MTIERNDPLQGDPRPGDRVLRLHINGVLDLIIPDGVDEESHGWDGWRDAAIQSALDDGRWLECTGVVESEVGVLGNRGWLNDRSAA